jgi:hypothetical protein
LGDAGSNPLTQFDYWGLLPGSGGKSLDWILKDVLRTCFVAFPVGARPAVNNERTVFEFECVFLEAGEEVYVKTRVSRLIEGIFGRMFDIQLKIWKDAKGKCHKTYFYDSAPGPAT